MPFRNGTAFMYNIGSLTMANRIRNFTPSGPVPPAPAICGPCCDPRQSEDHDAKAFVLCCMDFRLRDNTHCQLNRKGYKNYYDEVIAAGSSLGYNGLTGYPNWKQYIEDHFELGSILHNISEIIVIDHDKCGAYKVQYPEIESDPSLERGHHITDITACVNELWGKYNPDNGTYTDKRIPNLKVKGYLISIDGSNLELIHSRS
jgi:hypothetical protein